MKPTIDELKKLNNETRKIIERQSQSLDELNTLLYARDSVFARLGLSLPDLNDLMDGEREEQQ